MRGKEVVGAVSLGRVAQCPDPSGLGSSSIPRFVPFDLGNTPFRYGTHHGTHHTGECFLSSFAQCRVRR